jgi:hypothetical protein
MKLSKTQYTLMYDMWTKGRVIVEDKVIGEKGKFSYFTAEVDEKYAHAYGYPRRVLVSTVYVLLENGLLEECTLWPWHNNPQKAYKVSSKARTHIFNKQSKNTGRN